MSKLVWIGARPEASAAAKKEILRVAVEYGFPRLFLNGEELPPGAPAEGHLRLQDGEVRMEGARVKGVTLASPKDAAYAESLRNAVDCVVLDSTDWKVIPLENLLATFRGGRTKLVAVARSPDEAMLFLRTLEVGADGIVLLAAKAREVVRLRELLDAAGERLDLIEAEVVEVRPVGLGDRVCVDTCDLLEPGEGMLVGNASHGLFLVHGETVENGYVAPRPFRVNAGPVHAYILGPEGRTKYLSEVGTGDEVLLVRRDGRVRRSVVGRVKIERRPLVLLRARANGSVFSALLQNAETIRLVRGEKPVSVSELKVGDKVLARLERGGRHFGHRIDETIVER